MKKPELIVQFTDWIVSSVLYPLLPLLFAVIYALMRADNLSFEGLFGGTELYFFTVTILATTKHHLRSSVIDFRKSVKYNAISQFLSVFIVTTMFIFGIVYAEGKTDSPLDPEIVATTSILLVFFSLLFCVPLEWFLFVVAHRSE